MPGKRYGEEGVTSGNKIVADTYSSLFGTADSDAVTTMKRSGMTSEYKNSIIKLYEEIYGRGMPGQVGDSINDRATADKIWTLLNQVKTQGKDFLIADEGNRDLNVANGFISESDIARYDDKIKQAKIDAKEEAAKPKPFTPSGLMNLTMESTAKDAGYMKNPAWTGVDDKVNQEYIVDPNFKDAVRPIYSYDSTDTGKYFDTISKSEQAGTDKAVNAVNETANFVNPYATGSGSQIKAVAGMLDNITASQQARAFALGENANQLNYAGKTADYEKAVAKKTGARADLMGFAKYYDEASRMTDETARKNAWDYFNLSLGSTADALRTAADERWYNRETQLMADAAALNKPQEQNWWQGFIAPAIGAFTGGLGGAAANALMGNTTDNYFKTMSKYLGTGAGGNSTATAGVSQTGWRYNPFTGQPM